MAFPVLDAPLDAPPFSTGRRGLNATRAFDWAELGAQSSLWSARLSRQLQVVR
jgi:hypothetical protein